MQDTFDRDLRSHAELFPPIVEGNFASFPEVRAVDYKERPVDLVDWLNRVYRKELFPKNHLIVRHPAIAKPTLLTNHELWLRVSDVLAAEFNFTAKQHAGYKPRISDLVFREKKDFYCGSWSFFRHVWDPFIDLVEDPDQRDEVRESLKYGVDTASFSRPHTPQAPAFFRTKRKPVVTIPVYDEKYHQQRRGRDPRKHRSKVAGTRVRHGKITKHLVPWLAGKPVAHRPILLSEFKRGEKVGIFPTARKALMCQVTIHKIDLSKDVS